MSRDRRVDQDACFIIIIIIKVCAALLKNLRGCFDFAILPGASQELLEESTCCKDPVRAPAAAGW